MNRRDFLKLLGVTAAACLVPHGTRLPETVFYTETPPGIRWMSTVEVKWPPGARAVWRVENTGELLAVTKIEQGGMTVVKGLL